MNHLRNIIILITIQCSLSEWIITHYEGYDKPFIQNTKDNGMLYQCEAYNLQILAQQQELTKAISIKDWKPFEKTKILVEFIVPSDAVVDVKVQNKTLDFQDLSLSYGNTMINQCFNTNNYHIVSLEYEIVGKNFTEILINLSLINSNEDKYIGIKQIHVFQMQCPDNCLSCNENSCTKCREGYTKAGDGCVCSNVIFQNKCLQTCPIGYLPTQRAVCIQANKLEAIVSNSKQEAMQSKRLFLNQKITEQVKLTSSSDVYLEFDVTISNFELLQQFEIVINDIYQGSISNFDRTFYIAIYNYSETECNEFSDCLKIKLFTPIISLNTSLLNLDFSFKPIRNGVRSLKLEIEDNRQNSDSKKSQLIISNLKVIQLQIGQEECRLSNCLACSYINTYTEKCTQCQEGFFSYKGLCTEHCPKETVLYNNNECQDVIKIFQNGAFAIQNVAIQRYDSFGEVSFKNPRSNLYYRFNATNLIFGGNWLNQEFSKIIILQPHYALTYAFTIAFIDYDRQNSNTRFYYQLDGGDMHLISPENEIQIDGNSQLPDSIVNYSKYFLHTNDELMLTIGCDSVNYCFLSNYFLILHQCAPYCKQCTGPQKSDCLAYQTNLAEFNAKTKQCSRGYFEDQSQHCVKCQVSGCQECLSEYVCKVCKKQCYLRLQGQSCECQ